MSTTAITSATPLEGRPAWKALDKHYEEIRDLRLRDLFADDPTRGERLAAEGAGLYLDYSKNRITDETLGLLLQLAEESGLRERTEAMFRGDRINVSENRSVLHVALRMPRGESLARRGRRRRRGGERRPRPDGRLRRPHPLGRVEGAHGKADPEHRQHRHWRLRPRAGDGI